MSTPLSADFVYYGLPCSKPVQRTIEKRLSKWLKDKALATTWSRPFCYVYLQRDPSEKVVTCFIEVQLGTKIWSAVDYGRNTLHAFLKSLPQLRPRSSIYDLAPEPPDDATSEFTDELGAVNRLQAGPAVLTAG